MNRWGILFAGAALFFVLGCGVKAPPSGGDENLPNAKAGPFRLLREGEMPPQNRFAPYGIRRKGTRNPCAFDPEGSRESSMVWLYVASSEGIEPGADPVMIQRYDAPDGRSFDPRSPDAIVLEPSETWERGVVDGPSVLRVGSDVWMYYAAGEGIGLAVSGDGMRFTKHPHPVFRASGEESWEGGAIPSDPSVVIMSDGTFRMFYQAGLGIGEAWSEDGVAWQRLPGPALWPVPPPDFPVPEKDTFEEPFDDVSVGGPHAVLDVSPLGRGILRVYYAGSNRLGLWSLGMAARYEGETELRRAPGRVLGNGYSPTGPSVALFRDFTLIYFTAPENPRDRASATAIAVGVAPATVSLIVE